MLYLEGYWPANEYHLIGVHSFLDLCITDAGDDQCYPRRKLMDARNYSTPTLEELGTFEKLTQASGCPDALDATFPAGTPFGDLTCGAEDGMS
jgi:hypothetical protein